MHILVANGNTGEFYGLTTAEAERWCMPPPSRSRGRVPLLGGVGRSIGDACALANASRAAGATALMVHQPPDPFVSPRGVVTYVQRVADAGGGLPLMLYLRNDGIGLDTIEKLCAIEGVAGVKWASPTPLRLAEAIRRCPPDIVWVGGLAEPWAPPLCAVGARGFTSGLINVWPEHSVAIHAALEAGDYPRANRLIDIMSRFEEIRAEEQNGTNVTAVKAALQLIGDDCGADAATFGLAAHREAVGEPAYASGRMETARPAGASEAGRGDVTSAPASQGREQVRLEMLHRPGRMSG